MRKYLVTAVLLALLSFSMIAADKYDSELVVGTDQNPTTMDPAMYQDLASSQVMRNIFETLVAYTSDVQEIKPL
ncbi:MAG: ABC transporter substrate-binding protein, partial [Kosmotogaceae bacterium]|nr:ABC transporter substrate-binding protein [Kosmotogaceae bacterium]